MSNWLDELEELEKKATPGEWIADEPSNWRGLDARVFVAEPYGMVAQVPIEAWRPKSIGRNNAKLIASLRNSAPRLLRIAKAAEQYISLIDASCHSLKVMDAALAELRSALEEK